MHHIYRNFPSECPDVWIRLPLHKWPKWWSDIEDPVVLLERNLCGHPFAGLLWVRQFEEVLLWLGWAKVPNWECLYVHRKQGLFLSVYVVAIKMAGRPQNTAPMWKKCLKNVELEEPTSFLDHVCLGFTQRECRPNEDIVNQCREMFESRMFESRMFESRMFESRISATATEKYQSERNLTQKLSRGFTAWTYANSKVQHKNQNCRSIKAESCSEETV